MAEKEPLKDDEKKYLINEDSADGKKILSPEEIKLRKELSKKDEKLEKALEEIEKLKKEKSVQPQTAPEPTTAAEKIAQLSAQVELLTRQVITGTTGLKFKFREPTAADLVPEGEEVTFTARNIMYVVSSYRDTRGIEQLPPHKIIIFQYAASDIRKEGKEDTIRTYSQYTTNLKTEIEFLRNHPFYNVAFFENMNDVVNEDVMDTHFRIMAATQLQAATPESVLSRAQEYNISVGNKSINELRLHIVNAMAKQFRKQQKDINDDITRRRATAALLGGDATE